MIELVGTITPEQPFVCDISEARMPADAPLILVAEDDRITRMKLVRFLERELGARVLEAENGDKAWDVYQRTPEIQFVVSDWVMPDCTGVELTRRIRALEGRRYTYVILLSGRAEREDLLIGMTAGADEYLLKPFDPAELSLRVRAGLRIIRLEQQLAAQNEKLEDAYNSLEQAVQAASRVQRHLLPAPAYLTELQKRTGIAVSYEYQLCESLGGDLIGVLEPGGGEIALFLADVSGHGIAASMAAVSLASFIRTFLRSSAEPLDLITQANRFCNDEFPAEVYATMVYLLAHPGSGNGKLVVAGHPAVIKLSSAGEVSELNSTMPPLGMFADNPGPDAVVELSIGAGDRLVAYTDGVIETRNAAGIFFAREWLHNIIVESALEDAGGVPSRIVAALDEWRGAGVAPEDDITILSLQFGG